jgi:AraC-like DNA-binding protein
MATDIPAWLAPYVHSIQPYDVTYDVAPGVHIGMPSPHLTLVLPLDDPLDVSWSGRPATRGTSWSSVSGLHLAPAEIHHGRRQRGIQLTLTPAGARALLGVPAAVLAGELLDLGDVSPAVRALPERWGEARGWPARLAVVEDGLRRALSRHEAARPRAEIGRALALLTRGHRVAAVAEDVGYSRRRLSTLVRDEVGISPKDYQRLARFHVAHRLVREAVVSGDLRLSDVAADAGYADQSHLARDWADLAGCSPTRWVAREFPIVQATEGEGPEG